MESRLTTRLSVQNKLILLVYGILLIVGVPGALLLLYTERTDTAAGYRRSALTLATTIQSHLKGDMITSDGAHISQDLRNIVSSARSVKAIMILSDSQRIYASSDAALTGKSVDWELVARALESGNAQTGDYGDNTIAVVLPAPNEPECYSCHGNQARILGAIKVHVDKGPLNDQLRRQAWLMAAIGVSTFLALGLTITSFMRRTIAQPMMKTIAMMEKEQEKLIMQDRLASIGQLVSGVAHELNNPLTSVISFSDLLLQRELPEEIKADLKVVNDEANRAAGIVKNLLTFARKQPQEKQPIDVNEQIQRVLQLRAYDQKVNNIQVDLHLDTHLPLVMGNSSQLQQVFFNLIINAEFFMLQAHGKGTLTITTENAGDFVRVLVADDGPGITKEDMKYLFTPFFTTKEVGKGTGLGLSICQGITAEHGGTIYAKSKFGEGASFIVELPVARPETEAPG